MKSFKNSILIFTFLSACDHPTERCYVPGNTRKVTVRYCQHVDNGVCVSFGTATFKQYCGQTIPMEYPMWLRDYK